MSSTAITTGSPLAAGRLARWALYCTAAFTLAAASTSVGATEAKRGGALSKLTPTETNTSLYDAGDVCVTGLACNSVPPKQSHEASLAVAVRNYYADLRFEASPQRDAEALSGNCLNQRLKIVVSETFQVTWEIKESTRVSRWQGSVDPHSGSLKVSHGGVEVVGRDGAPVDVPSGAEVAGDFAKSRIAFGPCGAGEIIVRN